MAHSWGQRLGTRLGMKMPPLCYPPRKRTLIMCLHVCETQYSLESSWPHRLWFRRERDAMCSLTRCLLWSNGASMRRTFSSCSTGTSTVQSTSTSSPLWLWPTWLVVYGYPSLACLLPSVTCVVEHQCTCPLVFTANFTQLWSRWEWTVWLDKPTACHQLSLAYLLQDKEEAEVKHMFYIIILPDHHKHTFGP